jgi:hypothetical protein
MSSVQKTSVVHLEGVAHELGHDGAGPGPRPDRGAAVAGVEELHLAEELLADVRAFAE